MQHLSLAAHLGRTVQLDHCGGCRLVWFDTLESVNLSPLGWVALLRELQMGSGLVLPEARHATLSCPHCAGPFKTVRNRTRYGAFAALECPSGHGHLHTHTGVLAERGLARPLLPAERDALLRGRKQLACVNCGAPADGQATDCAYCGSPIVVIDLPRLMHALTRRLNDDSPSPRADGRAVPWHCMACGSALDPARQAQCPACGTAAMAPSLPDVEPLLEAAEAELKSPQRAAAAPPPDRRVPRERRPAGWRDTTAYRLREWFRSDEDEPAHRTLERALWQWLWDRFSDAPPLWRWGTVALVVALVVGWFRG
jgi:DNA-directed RNA polymerase subunit RPC12/RpoP